MDDEFFAAITPVVEELERLGVAYYLGGSLASSLHGTPRATRDADLVADLSPCHVAPLVEALRSEYYIDGHRISEAIARQSCFNLIHFASSFKIDIFVVKNRPYNRTALARIGKYSAKSDSPWTRFFLASPEDSILAKLECYRLGNEVSEQHWRDVLGVMKVSGPILDRAYLDRWAVELGVADLLARAWQEAEA